VFNIFAHDEFSLPKLGFNLRQIKKSKARLTSPAEYQHPRRFAWRAEASCDASRSGRQKQTAGVILITTSTHILSPSFAGPGLSSQTQPEYKRGIARDSIKAHSLSPSSLGLEKFSSQTQLDIISGLFGRDKDNDETTHSLSPSSLGLKPLDTNPAQIQPRDYPRLVYKLILSPLLRWVWNRKTQRTINANVRFVMKINGSGGEMLVLSLFFAGFGLVQKTCQTQHGCNA
jgi:hypothetical protein